MERPPRRTALARWIGVAALVAAPWPLAGQVCGTEQHAQIDFLLGTWEIRADDGRFVGTDVVSRELGGCVVREVYRTSTGTSGESLTTLDPESGTWRQRYVDSGGTRLSLAGSATQRELVLTDDSGSQRFRWRAEAADTIRQVQEVRTDAGDWSERFSARWVRVSDAETRSGGEPGDAVREELAPLAGFLGTWVVTPIEPDSAGAWVRGLSTTMEVRPTLGGRFLVGSATARLAAGWVSWEETFGFDPFQSIIRMTWKDSLAGLLDEYTGTIEDGVLRLDNLASGTFWTTPDGAEFAFRLEYDLNTVEGVREARIYASTDRGASWSLAQRTEFRRVE